MGQRVVRAPYLWTQTAQSHTFSYGNHNSAIGIEKARTG
jgi:hypothetical protein